MYVFAADDWCRTNFHVHALVRSRHMMNICVCMKMYASDDSCRKILHVRYLLDAYTHMDIYVCEHIYVQYMQIHTYTYTLRSSAAKITTDVVPSPTSLSCVHVMYLSCVCMHVCSWSSQPKKSTKDMHECNMITSFVVQTEKIAHLMTLWFMEWRVVDLWLCGRRRFRNTHKKHHPSFTKYKDSFTCSCANSTKTLPAGWSTSRRFRIVAPSFVTVVSPMSSTNILSSPTGPRELLTTFAIDWHAMTVAQSMSGVDVRLCLSMYARRVNEVIHSGQIQPECENHRFNMHGCERMRPSIAPSTNWMRTERKEAFPAWCKDVFMRFEWGAMIPAVFCMYLNLRQALQAHEKHHMNGNCSEMNDIRADSKQQ